jgi:hypothetical protein
LKKLEKQIIARRINAGVQKKWAARGGSISICLLEHESSTGQAKKLWQGNKDSNLGMLESKSSALTSLAIPLR